MLRVQSLGVSAFIALMVTHRQEARSMSVSLADQLSALLDDGSESTDDESADRRLIGAFQISYS